MKTTPIERFCRKVSGKNKPIDPVGLIEALDKTDFPSGFRFRARYEVDYGFESERADTKDNLIGLVFDKCSFQHIYEVYCPLELMYMVVYMRKDENLV